MICDDCEMGIMQILSKIFNPMDNTKTLAFKIDIVTFSKRQSMARISDSMFIVMIIELRENSAYCHFLSVRMI